MAFSSSEKARIRMYLGKSQLWLDVDTQLESAMSVIEANNPEAVALIQGWLAELANIDTRLTTYSRAGVLKVDEIELEPSGGGASSYTKAMRSSGRQLVNRIAITLGVRPAQDAFAEGSLSYWGFGI